MVKIVLCVEQPAPRSAENAVLDITVRGNIKRKTGRLTRVNAVL